MEVSKEITKIVVVSFEFSVTADNEQALKRAIADIRESPASSCLSIGWRRSFSYERSKKLGKVLSSRKRSA